MLPISLAFVVLAASTVAQDLIIHCGETKTLVSAPLFDSVIIEPGGVLRYTGREGVEPARLRARRGIRVEGMLELSGEDAHPVRFQTSGWLQENGAIGGSGGSNGGSGNPRRARCRRRGVAVSPMFAARIHARPHALDA